MVGSRLLVLVLVVVFVGGGGLVVVHSRRAASIMAGERSTPRTELAPHSRKEWV